MKKWCGGTLGISFGLFLFSSFFFLSLFPFFPHILLLLINRTLFSHSFSLLSIFFLLFFFIILSTLFPSLNILSLKFAVHSVLHDVQNYFKLACKTFVAHKWPIMVKVGKRLHKRKSIPTFLGIYYHLLFSYN